MSSPYQFSEVRARVVQIVGRSDLEDDGQLSIYVNDAQRLLDDAYDCEENGTWFTVLAAGQYLINPQRVRRYSRVWRMGLDDTKVALALKTPDWVTENFPKVSESVTEYSGVPAYWSPVPTRDVTDPPATAPKGHDLVSTNWPFLQRLLILPVTSEAVTIGVDGLFYSAPLVADTDISFWSARHFQLLVYATCAVLSMAIGRVEDGQRFMAMATEGIRAANFQHAEELVFGPVMIRG